MFKKFGILWLVICITIFGTANAFADVTITDPEQGDMIVSGQFDGISGNNNLVSIFIVPKNKDISDINEENDGAALHIGAEALTSLGSFSHSFRFSDYPNDTYKIILKCNNTVNEILFNYVSWDFIQTEIYGKIETGELTGVQLSDILKKYDISLGINLNNITNDRDKAILSKRVTENKLTFKNKSDEIIADVFTEIKLLNDILNAQYWSVVEAEIRNTVSLTGISLANYEIINDKQAVCQLIKGKSFSDYNELFTYFNTIVTNSLNNQNTSTGNSSSSPSGGGGGGSNFSQSNSDYGLIKADVPLNPAPAFTDISEYPWAVSAIEALFDKKVINGIGDNKFGPEGNVKREEFVKMCALAFELPLEEQECDFADVNEADWFYNYITACKNSGIISGISENQFGVGSYITRQDIAVILYRCASYAGIEFNMEKTDFSDFDIISDYAAEAVSYLSGAGIINGMDDNSFTPHDYATRAQAAKLIYGILEIMKG